MQRRRRRGQQLSIRDERRGKLRFGSSCNRREMPVWHDRGGKMPVRHGSSSPMRDRVGRPLTGHSACVDHALVEYHGNRGLPCRMLAATGGKEVCLRAASSTTLTSASKAPHPYLSHSFAKTHMSEICTTSSSSSSLESRSHDSQRVAACTSSAMCRIMSTVPGAPASESFSIVTPSES